MTLLEFTNMHLTDGSGTEQPVYVFMSTEIFDYSYWSEMKKHAELLFTIASDFVCSYYLKPEFANAEVKNWGVIDGQLCVVIDTLGKI